jgi:hypothetical protein
MGRNRLIAPAALLIAIQVIHGAIPAETDAEGYVGLVAGLIGLVASIAALVGVTRGRSWGRTLLGTTGLSIAVGFLLYHALPIHSPLTNPYFGEDKVGLVQWAPVIACIGIGLWAAWEAFLGPDAERADTPAVA